MTIQISQLTQDFSTAPQISAGDITAVSYTHLDVYKRQVLEVKQNQCNANQFWLALH